MILTANAVYLHVPKTGGNWINSILLHKTEKEIEHGIPKKKDLRPYIFCFVRNPWDWYVSFFEYIKNGSEIENSKGSPFSELSILNKNFTANFDSYLNFFSGDTPQEEKKQLFNLIRIKNLYKISLENGNILQNSKLLEEKLNNIYSHEIIKEWSNSNSSFIEIVFNRYIRESTHIGKYENLRENFLEFTRMSGDLDNIVQHDIEELPKINVTKNKKDYRTYYNDTQAELVFNSARFLDQYGYKFE